MRTACAVRFWRIDVSTVIEEKKRLRALLKERRAALDTAQKKEWDSAIVEQIAASEQYRRASAILLYAPLSGEINLLPLARLARKDGKAIAFPRCDTSSCTITFYRLEQRERLVAGAYGIFEPPATAAPCEPDETTLCILPALSFDPRGARLGYGKGYYDRFLKDFPGVAVGAVYQSMILKHVPTEAHDHCVSMLFTEKGVLHCDADRSESDQPKESAAALEKVSIADAMRARVLRMLDRLVHRKPQTALAVVGESEKNGAMEAPMRGLLAPPVLVAVTFLLLLFSRLIDTYLTNRNNEYAIVILLQLMIFLIPAVIYGFLRGDRLSARIRLRAPKLKHAWFAVCMLIVMVSGGLLCGIFTGGISSLTGNFTLYDIFVARSDGGASGAIYVILAYGILPAFCEELIYRAILCAEYERFGVSVSIIASALFFAMLHFSFPLFLSYVFLGAILAGAMYTTRSFFTAFFLHLAYNLFCLFGQPYLSAFYVNAGSNEIFIFCLVVLFLLFAAFGVGEARKIYHVYARENEDSSYTVALPLRQLPKTLAHALLSPACAVCAFIWLIVSVINLF